MNTPVLPAARFVGRKALRLAVATTEPPHAVLRTARVIAALIAMIISAAPSGLLPYAALAVGLGFAKKWQARAEDLHSTRCLS